MPHITTNLAVNYQNIQLPVATRIARDVMRVTDIDPNTPLYMKDEFDRVKQQGSGVGEDSVVKFNSDSQLIVVARDTIQNSSLTNQTVRSNDEPPYLEDRRLGFSIRPVMLVSDLQLTFTYRARSREQAQAWRDEQAVRKAEYRQAIYHEIQYDIPLHDAAIGLVAMIHERREKIAGYGQTFPEYFNELAQTEISAVGARDGDLEKLTISVPHTQGEITGWFDFDEIPQETKDDQATTWTIEFTYNIRYKRCTHLYITYPLMVHQQLIPKQYYSRNKQYTLQDMEMYGSIGIGALHQVLKANNALPPLEATCGMRFPHWDDWMAGYRTQPQRTIPAATWMIALSPKDPQDVLNLEQIPDVRFTLEMLRYMKSQHAGLTKRGGASLLFTLYADSVNMGEAYLYVDENLNVRTTVPLDLRKQYHLRMSFPTYYNDFSSEALIGISDNPIATLQLFQSIVYDLDVEYALNERVSDNWLDREYVEWFYGWLFDHGYGQGGNPANNGNGGSGNGSGGSSGSNGQNSGGRPGGGGTNLPGGVGTGGGGAGGIYHWVGGRWVQWLTILTKRKKEA